MYLFPPIIFFLDIPKSLNLLSPKVLNTAFKDWKKSSCRRGFILDHPPYITLPWTGACLWVWKYNSYHNTVLNVLMRSAVKEDLKLGKAAAYLKKGWLCKSIQVRLLQKTFQTLKRIFLMREFPLGSNRNLDSMCIWEIIGNFLKSHFEMEKWK